MHDRSGSRRLLTCFSLDICSQPFLKKQGFYKKMADESSALVVFQDKKIRRTWFNEEWWFVAVDIITALTDSKDPSGYLKDMRRRDEGFAQGWGQIATPLSIDTPEKTT